MKPLHLANLTCYLRLLTLPGLFAAVLFAAPTPPNAPADSTQISLHAIIPGDASKTPALVRTQAAQTLTLDADGTIATTIKLKTTTLHGEAATLSLALDATPKNNDPITHNLTAIDSPRVRDWALRTAPDGRRYIDLRLATPLKKGETLDATLRLTAQLPPLPAAGYWPLAIPVIAAGDDTQTLTGTLDLSWAEQYRVAAVAMENILPADAPTATDLATAWQSRQLAGSRKARFTLAPDSVLRLTLAPADGIATLDRLTLRGDLQPDGRLGFILEATARARIDGATIPLLAGDAALRTHTPSTGCIIRTAPLIPGTRNTRPLRYELIFPKAGEFPIRLEFDARVTESGDWRQINFAIPAARIATLSLGGFPEQTKFVTDAMPPLARDTAPSAAAPRFTGHLAANGDVAFSWMSAGADADGRLFYSTEEVSQIIVSPGLLRQTGAYTYKVLQGKLDTLRLALTGDGEILRVTAPDILSWEIEPSGAGVPPAPDTASDVPPPTPSKHLLVRLSQPVTTTTTLTIETQTPLGDFPARFTPLALAPLGGVRHSGFVHVANEGAVRLETTPLSGLTQVAPALFPQPATPAKTTAAEPSEAQTFVYRISGYDNALQIQADNILPETSLSAILVYTVGESDLAIDADLELDVREAPLRELLIHIPAGYIVNNSASPAASTDTAPEFILGPPLPPPAPGGQPARRELKIIFPKPIQGRHLLQCRLERDRAADLADWTLEPLAFPGTKSVRGFVGVAAVPGLRVTLPPAPGLTTGLTEIAPAFFPKKIPGLQQAWRLRDPVWQASVKIERLDMTVQSDALHLFAIREGLVSASTMINYAITGAPLGSFRFEVPATLRNLEFSGRDIRSWKRDDATGTVEVSLHKPVSGAVTLLGTYDLPLDPRGGATGFAGLRPLGVQSEQGYVIITSDLQFNLTQDAVSPALVAVEPREIPAEYRMMFDAPLLAAYQYTARPFELRLNLAPRARGATVNQVVDFASLNTRVARDGQIITEAHYVVKSHGHPHLRVGVPAGLRLWTARVDDAEALPVVDGGDTLIPMPPRTDANAIVTVDLRFAGTPRGAGVPPAISNSATRANASIRLTAPLLAAPVISTRWQVTPDQGRRLQFLHGNLAPADATNVPQPVTGLRTLARGLFRQSGMTMSLLAALGLGVAGSLVFSISLRLNRSGRTLSARITGVLAALITIGALLLLAAVFHRAVNTPPSPPPPAAPLEFTAPIHLGDTGLFLELASLPATTATAITTPTLVMTQWILLIAGAACLMLALVRRAHLLRALAWTLLGMGALLSPNGIAWFTAIAALFVAGETLLPGLRGLRLPPPPPRAAALIALPLFLSAFSLQPSAFAQTADSVTQRITIEGQSITAAATLRVTGQAGDRFDLLAAPAVLTRCDLTDAVRLVRETRPSGTMLRVELLKPGPVSLTFNYELPLAKDAAGFTLPTSVAASDTATIALSGADKQITSRAAVSITEKDNTAHLVLLPQPARDIGWSPRARDRRAEKLVFYAETADLYTPAPGVIDGRHRAVIRPAQGMLAELNITIPPGLTVSNVSGTNVGRWRFIPNPNPAPAERRLNIRLLAASAAETTLLIETQAATGPLPQTTTLHPLIIADAASQIGFVGIATGDEVQIIDATPARLLPVNVDDFPAALRTTDTAANATLRRSYRHSGPAGASLVLKTAAVEPDVRVTGAHNLSLGEDRIVLSTTLVASITRAGVFRLSLPLPAGLEVESLSGPALSHWTEITEPGSATRIIVLHLRGRTLGRQQFTMSFAGPGLARLKHWETPRVLLREASRQTGELYLTPEEGVRLHVSRRENATQFDPIRNNIAGDFQSSVLQPSALSPRGALAFRLLQRDWHLAFDIETLAPWIQCAYLQDLTLRDGQLRGVVNFDYTIENAATKTLRVQLPAAAASVRFSGQLVADSVAVPGTPGLWEIKLQRRALGKVALQATYQLPASTSSETTTTTEQIAGVRSTDAGLQHGWLALRASGRLELKLGALPSALQTTDWQSVPATLRQGAPEPAAILRIVENEFVLPVQIATHDPARLLPLRVEKAGITTVLSDEGMMLTQTTLSVRLTEKRILRLNLPPGASYWHGFVNDESVRAATDGDALLLPVTPNPVEGQPSIVEFYYSAPTRNSSQNSTTFDHRLHGPRFDVPLENITWRVHLPGGRVLARQQSDLQYAGTRARSGADSSFLSSISDYKSHNKEVLAKKGKEADKLIQLGNKFRQAGDQEKARQALALANTLSKGNDALNEDARVQFNALRMEQIEVGMNRLRQTAVTNAGLPTDAIPQQLAPQTLMAGGSTNYAPAEIAQLRSANTAEDNAVIRKVAGRFLTQQQTTMSVLDSIRTTIPDTGDTLTFTRALQVGTDSDLSMRLTLKPIATAADFPLWPLLIAGALLFTAALITPALMKR